MQSSQSQPGDDNRDLGYYTDEDQLKLPPFDELFGDIFDISRKRKREQNKVAIPVESEPSRDGNADSDFFLASLSVSENRWRKVEQLVTSRSLQRICTQTLAQSQQEKKVLDKALVASRCGRWTDDEHAQFLVGVIEHGKDWKKIQPLVKSRNILQISTHAQKVFKRISAVNDFNAVGPREYVAAIAFLRENKEAVFAGERKDQFGYSSNRSASSNMPTIIRTEEEESVDANENDNPDDSG